LEKQNPSKTELPPKKPPRPKPTVTSAWSQHGKSQLTEPKVATRKSLQAPNQKSNPKHKKPPLKNRNFHQNKSRNKKI
jgi:hypothetical protein